MRAVNLDDINVVVKDPRRDDELIFTLPSEESKILSTANGDRNASVT